MAFDRAALATDRNRTSTLGRRIRQALAWLFESLAVLLIGLVVLVAGTYVLSLAGGAIVLGFAVAYVLLLGADWSTLAFADWVGWSVIPLVLLGAWAFLAARREHKEYWRYRFPR